MASRPFLYIFYKSKWKTFDTIMIIMIKLINSVIKFDLLY